MSFGEKVSNSVLNVRRCQLESHSPRPHILPTSVFRPPTSGTEQDNPGAGVAGSYIVLNSS
jgi:hypothetical protein